MSELSADDLVALVRRVFQPGAGDSHLAILLDLPDAKVPDTPAWSERRAMVADWFAKLKPRAGELGLEALHLALYRNAHANNADLPEHAVYHAGGELPATAEALGGEAVPMQAVLGGHQILVAPTQFSATAPLKVAARQHGFRAATMPGFSRDMLPALKLDYELIGARVARMKELLDEAEACRITFAVGDREHRLMLDLRHRTGHASGGVFPTGGEAGNLPSGEAYIVPYEGERPGEASRTEGEIPVQFGDDVVVYSVRENRAVEVLTENSSSTSEAEYLRTEPAYGNLSELGLGVLGDFGLEPTGEILLDEKLGLHIAFGRSEHFGGQVGPDSFSSPDAVVHIDRVYIPALQPAIRIAEAVLEMPGGRELPLMIDGRYQIEL